MRGVFVIVACVGCSFHGSSERAPDAANTHQIIDDTAADFAGTLSGGVVATRGALEPDTFVPGGLHATGFHQPGGQNLILKTTSLDAIPPLGTSTGEIYGFPMDQSWPNSGTTFPKGLGLNQGDSFAILFDGEIFLRQGPSVLQLLADDGAVFEVRTGIDDLGTRIAADFNDHTPVMVPVNAPADGWYPIRGAMGEGVGDARVFLGTAVDLNGLPTIDGSLLRARTTEVHGLVMDFFLFSELEIGPSISFDPGPLDHPSLLPGPSDYNVGGTFSLRYEGQLLIDQTGSYLVDISVGADPDDGYRLFVDGQLVAYQWLGMPALAEAPLQLTAGWHAIVIDYADNTGAATISLALESADHVLLPPVLADHLRPVITEGFAPSPGAQNVMVVGGAAAIDYTIAPITPPGAIVDYVDLDYVLAGTRTNFAATLSAGGVSEPLIIRPMPNEVETGTHYDYDAYHPNFHGFAADTPWHLMMGDAQAGENVQMTLELMISHHGGPLAPFSTTLDYVSTAHELTNATSLGAIHVIGALAGATLKVQVHTSDDPVAITQAPWIDVDNDAIPAVDVHRYVQYHLQITDDGWAFPQVEQVVIDYAAP